MARPRKIKSPEELDRKVDEYIEECRREEEPITWTGMALALGFHGHDELNNYKDYEGFSGPIKRAKILVEREYEKRLHGNNPTGAISALKNMGWSDRTDVDVGPRTTLLIKDLTGSGRNQLEHRQERDITPDGEDDGGE